MALTYLGVRALFLFKVFHFHNWECEIGEEWIAQNVKAIDLWMNGLLKKLINWFYS